jgi:hypothetical protein
MFPCRDLKILNLLCLLTLIVVAMMQPVQAKLIENQGSPISQGSISAQYLHDHADGYVFDCHSGHVLAILKVYSFSRSSYVQIAYDWVIMSDYSVIMTEDPPPPK